jgi:putative tricarboxylic transport membrane protein
MITCASAQMSSFEIMAPAGPGGGTDQVARSMHTALQKSGIAKSVQVVNVPGAGGTIGLAQFARNKAGDPTALIIGGYVMIGATLTNKSPVTLSDVTPIARLRGEPEAFVVPAQSPIKTIADLAAAMRKDPGAVAIAGGSSGGVDHIAAGLFAQAIGVDPTKVNYIAYSGGGEALPAMLGGKVAAGISGYSELEAHIKSGALRLLAVTSDTPVEGVDAPTLKGAGYDVVLENWHMVAAAPGITAEQTAAITDAVTAMARSKEWQELLSRNNWRDRFLAGGAFKQQLQSDMEATRAVLTKIGLVK